MPRRVKGYRRDAETGARTEHEMYPIALREAVRRHPREWSYQPWPAGEDEAAAGPKADRRMASKAAGPHVARKGGLNTWAIVDGDRIIFGPVKDKHIAEARLAEMEAGPPPPPVGALPPAEPPPSE